MSNEGFRCNCPGCDGQARLPCEAIQELESLRARVRELEEKLSLSDDDRSCGEISCEDCNARYLAQRRRIRELEEEMER